MQQVETLLTEVETLTAELNASKFNINAQQTLYTGAKEKYNEGLINYIELNSYRTNVEKATVEYIQVEAKKYFKQKMLEIYLESDF